MLGEEERGEHAGDARTERVADEGQRVARRLELPKRGAAAAIVEDGQRSCEHASVC